MRLISIISIAVIIFFISFLSFIIKFSNIPYDNTKIADAIIVLTGGHARLTQGIKLLEENKGQRMLLSGVNKNISNKSIISALGLRNDELIKRVDIGRCALNTAGNAIETALWVNKYNYKSIYIVTNDYHMLRSLLELKMVLPNKILYPAPIKDYNSTQQLWHHLSFKQFINLIAEFFKYIRTNIKYYFTILIAR